MNPQRFGCYDSGDNAGRRRCARVARWLVGGACAALLGGAAAVPRVRPLALPQRRQRRLVQRRGEKPPERRAAGDARAGFFHGADDRRAGALPASPPAAGVDPRGFVHGDRERIPGHRAHDVRAAAPGHVRARSPAIAAQVWDPVKQRLLFAWVAGWSPPSVPMSAYYGKMPNHEVPGLLFFLLGVRAVGVSLGPVIGSGRDPGLLLPGPAPHFPPGTPCCAFSAGSRCSGMSTQRRQVVSALAVGHAAPDGGPGAAAVGRRLDTSRLAIGLGGLLVRRERRGRRSLDRLGFLNHALGIGINRFAQLPGAAVHRLAAGRGVRLPSAGGGSPPPGSAA